MSPWFMKNSSRSLETPPIPLNDTKKQKLENRIERLKNENAKLMETKKEVMGRCQQLEREMRQLNKEVASHEITLKKAVMDCPHSKEGKNYLEAYLESRFKEFKGSMEYQ
ncbi:UNVERIFIED_CONTAM: hypothetical protein Sindi_1432200 [Sesamum indicum]